MLLGKDKFSKRRNFFSILILFSFMISILPGGMRNTRAEELNREETLTKIELSAEVIWTGVPDGEAVPDTTINLMSGEVVVESIEVTDGSTLVKFTPVDKHDADGNLILYTIEQEPLENYNSETREFVIENTFIAPLVEEVEAVKSDSIIEEDTISEEPIVEEPSTEEPIVEEPIVEEPTKEEPIVEEPIVEEPIVEEPLVDEAVKEVPLVEEPEEETDDFDIYEPSGSDRVIPAYVISSVPTKETLGIPEEKSLNDATRSFSPMASASISSIVTPTVPGQVTIDKYAEPVPGLVNTWDITLRIEGMDTEESSDIVLVIDRSGSMAGSKLTGAKNAAKAFVDAMAYKPNTRIAIVSFASAFQTSTTVTVNQSFLNPNSASNINELKSAIDGLVALGGTNTQAGIREAQLLLQSSTADNKHMVLLSDGEPTQSYRVTNNNSNFEYYGQVEDVEDSDGDVNDRTVHYRTKSDLPAASYDYGVTAGGGYVAYTYYKRVGSSRYYSSHGNNAISQSKMFKDAGGGRVLWTIALETTTYGNSVLNSIASPGKAYTASTSDLNTIFLQIAGSINSAAKDTVVVDPMAAGFEIPASEIPNITKTQGTVAYAGGVLTWTVGDLSQEISPGSNIRYAELKYRVSINDSILGLPVPADGMYPTNGDAEVSYKDSNDVTQELDFPVPKVNPIFLKVKKILMDADGNVITDPLRQFPIKIMSDAADGDTIYAEYNETYNLIPDQLITKTNLRLADTYTVSENAPDYDVTIKVNGAVTSTFVIQPPVGTADSGQPDIEVEVTNKEKPLGKLILNKILLDENNDPIVGDLREFTFNITGPDGYNTTRVLKGGETKEIPGLKYGEYTVVEADQVNLTAAGFTITSDPTDGKVTLAWNNKEDTVEITNKYVSPKISVIAKKLWEGGKDVDHVAVTLTLYRQIGAGLKTEVTGVTPSIVPASGTATEFTYTWSNLPKTDKFGDLYIYTVDELTVPNGYDKSISEDGLTVKNKAKTSDLQLLKTGVDDAPLQGAEFDLYLKVDSTTPGAISFAAEGGGTIYGIRIEDDTYPDGRLKTGADGKTQIVEDLEAGYYFVVERVAPYGYLIYEYPIEFEIVATKILNDLTIENEPAPMIPATGGIGTMLFTILGIGIMGGALFGLKKHNHNNRGKGENIMKGRKLFTLLFTMLVLFVFAAPTMVKATQTAPRTTDVTIHKMELFSPKDGLPKDHDGTELTPAQLDAALGVGNYDGLQGVEFTYWKVPTGDIATYNAMNLVDLNVYPNDTLTTDVDGLIELDNLVDGFYYFRETFKPVNVTSVLAVPFLIGLPTMNSDGTAFLDHVHVYPKNITVRGAVVLTKFAGEAKLAGAKFRLYTGVAPAGVEYVPEGGAAAEYTTNAQGEIILNNLPVGSYYFKETFAPSAYLLDQTPIPFSITANGKVTVVNGLRTGETGDVKFVEFNNFEEPDVTKSVLTPGTVAGTGNFQEEIPFYIDIELPADILEYTMLEVSDMISSKLDYKENLVVSGSLDGTTFNPLVLTTQYTIEAQPALNADGELKIAFVPAQLKVGEAALKYVRVYFHAAINETAIMGQAILNNVTVDYNNGFTPGDDTSNDVEVYTGGKNFKKTNGTIGLAGAEFAVKNAAGKFLKITAGEYEWVNTLAETTFRLVSDANGLFNIKGLKYELTGGTTYYLYETKAPMSTAGYPYQLIETDIPFLVNGTSFYSDPAAIALGTAPATATPQDVLNTLGPQIPQTGGIGTILFTVIGGGLMGSALMLNKKRNKA